MMRAVPRELQLASIRFSAEYVQPRTTTDNIKPGAMRVITTAIIRPQRDVVGANGSMCKAWEFDYHMATFYIQETDSGYSVIEETRPRGGWIHVQPERRQLILAEFERARRRRTPSTWQREAARAS